MDLIGEKRRNAGSLQGIPVFNQAQLLGQFPQLALTEYIDAIKILLQPDDGRKDQDEISQGALVDNEKLFSRHCFRSSIYFEFAIRHAHGCRKFMQRFCRTIDCIKQTYMFGHSSFQGRACS